MRRSLSGLSLLCLWLSLPLLPLAAQPMVLDPTFAPAVEADFSVIEAARYTPAPDRRLIAFGRSTFTHVNHLPVPHAIARLLPDGSLDTTFTAELRSGEIVSETVALADGRILVVTESTSGNPSRLVRLLASGRIDPAFSPSALIGEGPATPTLLSDGRVIIWGAFNSLGGVARNGLARVLSDGTIDATFAPALGSAPLEILSLVATPDDGVVLSAIDHAQYDPFRHSVVRLTRTGAIDPSFAPTTPTESWSIVACLADNRLLVVNNGLRRLLPDGSVDATFAPQIPRLASVRRVLPLPNDRLAVEAATGTSNSDAISSVFILKPDGVLESDCRDLAGAEPLQYLRAVLSDGSVAIVQGLLVWPNRGLDFGMTYYPDMAEPTLSLADPAAGTLTSLPTTIEARRAANISRLTLDAAGRVLVEGDFTRIAGAPRAGYARFNPDGTLDPTFDPVAASPLFHLPDGRIVASRTTLGPAEASGYHSYVKQVIRLTSDGGIDPTFTPAGDLNFFGVFSPDATWLTTAPDGRILVCALERDTPPDTPAKLVWLAPDGAHSATLSTRFAFPLDALHVVQSAVVLPDGKLLLGVQPTVVNGASTGVLVRLNPDGSTDTSYHPNSSPLSNDPLFPISIPGARPLPDGRAYVFGVRVELGAVYPFTVLRLNADGSPDTFVDKSVVDGRPLSDGSYLYGAERFHADGSRDLNYRLVTDYDFSLQSAVLAGDGSLWIGGHFSTINGLPRSGLARFLPAEVAGFTVQPENQTTAAGSEVTFQAEIGTAAAAAFQWTFNTAAIPGATSRTLRLAHPNLAAAGAYRLVATVGGKTYTSDPATLTVERNTARLVNFSARCLVSPGASPQIGGLVLRNALPRRVLLRSIGRGLPIDNPGFTLLPDPTLSVRRGSSLIAQDNGSALASALADLSRQVGAFPPRAVFPPNAPTRDSALVLDLPAGAYTAQTTSRDGRDGLSLFEFYDADIANDDNAAANVSIRGRTAPGNEALIAGFVIRGHGRLRLLIRGIGPGLGTFGVGSPLADPQITLYRDHTVLAANDNWSDQMGAADLAAAAQRAGAFPLSESSRDAAFLVPLEAGTYTVHGAATDSSAGEMMIELYVVEY